MLLSLTALCAAQQTNVTIHGAHGKYTHALFDAGAEAEVLVACGSIRTLPELFGQKRGFKDYLSKLQDDLTALAEQFKSPTLQTFFNVSSAAPQLVLTLTCDSGSILDRP